MQNVILAVFMNINGFTGREHSQVVVLLAILALISIVIWMLIVLSILVRQGVIILLRLLGHIAARRALHAKGSRQ